MARAFLEHFVGLWRLDDPRAELRRRRIDVDRSGASHVRFEQVWRGLLIPGAELNVHLDRDRRVVLVNGSYFPSPRDVETTPKLDEDAARRAAAREIGSDACASCAAELVVFADRGAEPRLAWRLTPPKQQLRGEELTIDAESGSLLRRLPTALSSGAPK